MISHRLAITSVSLSQVRQAVLQERWNDTYGLGERGEGSVMPQCGEASSLRLIRHVSRCVRQRLVSCCACDKLCLRQHIYLPATIVTTMPLHHHAILSPHHRATGGFKYQAKIHDATGQFRQIETGQ